jgi:hypothetical protein
MRAMLDTGQAPWSSANWRSAALVPNKAVGWLSGLRRHTRNVVYPYGYREFKSHPHRFARDKKCGSNLPYFLSEERA